MSTVEFFAINLRRYQTDNSELAEPCAERTDGWLRSGHISWLLAKANSAQEEALCLSFRLSKANVRQLLKRRKNTRRIIFVAKVGKALNDSTFFATYESPGCHWILLFFDTKGFNKTIYYCDSLGWQCPPNIKNHLSNLIGLSLSDYTINLMHPFNGFEHVCNSDCFNFPIQRCRTLNVSGIIASFCAVICAVDIKQFVEHFGKGQESESLIHNPTLNERSLQGVIISWFMTDRIDISLIFPAERHTTDNYEKIDHMYCKPPPKRICTYDRLQQYIEYEETEETDTTTTTTATNNHTAGLLSDTRATLPKVSCPVCKVKMNRRSLLRHQQRRHQNMSSNSETSVPGKGTYKCPECLEIMTSMDHLMCHFQDSHHKEIKVCEAQFSTENEFMRWKKETEARTNSRFIRNRGQKRREDVSITYYYCHRSGTGREVSNRKRSTKRQGSCKTGYRCTAFMKVKTRLKDKTVDVEYSLAHIGHSLDVAHLNMSYDLRKSIADKLSQGMDTTRILNDLRESTSIEKKASLVTRKDINNIRSKFNISSS